MGPTPLVSISADKIDQQHYIDDQRPFYLVYVLNGTAVGADGHTTYSFEVVRRTAGLLTLRLTGGLTPINPTGPAPTLQERRLQVAADWLLGQDYDRKYANSFDGHLREVCATLLQAFFLDEVGALEVLDDWNRRRSPPFRVHYILQVLREHARTPQSVLQQKYDAACRAIQKQSNVIAALQQELADCKQTIDLGATNYDKLALRMRDDATTARVKLDASRWVNAQLQDQLDKYRKMYGPTPCPSQGPDVRPFEDVHPETICLGARGTRKGSNAVLTVVSVGHDDNDKMRHFNAKVSAEDPNTFTFCVNMRTNTIKYVGRSTKA